MIRAVFDTVVFVRSLLNPFSRSGRLVFQHSDRYTLVLSPAMIREILEVLQRPEITRKFRTVADFDLGRVLDLLAQAEVLETTELSAVSRDPKDDKILATAAAGSADYIVSEDRDLLDLVEYAGVRIVDTASFLGILLNDGET